MSNVQYFINAIRQQTEAVEYLTFKQVVESEFVNYKPEEIEEAWALWKEQRIFNSNKGE